MCGSRAEKARHQVRLQMKRTWELRKQRSPILKPEATRTRSDGFHVRMRRGQAPTPALFSFPLENPERSLTVGLLALEKSGAPSRTRTCGLLIRSQKHTSCFTEY